MHRASGLLLLAASTATACGGADRTPLGPSRAATGACPAPAEEPRRAVPAATACRPAPPAATALVAELAAWARQSERRENGALTSFQAQLFRVLPRLHERGHVQSIVATHAAGAHGPILALTMIPRGEEKAALAFATAACDGGEPELLGEPVPLAAADARITYATRVRLGASALTELQVDLGDGPFEHGHALPPKVTHASALVGEPRGALAVTSPAGASFGVLAMLPALEREAPKTRDVPLLGSGWYPLGDAAVYLLVHETVPRPELRCTKDPPPSGPPSLRLLARADAQRGLVTTDLGVAFLVGSSASPPSSVVDDPTLRLRGTEPARGGYAHSKVQWLWGLYPTLDAARVAARAAPGATVFASEPPSGTAPLAPFALPLEPGGTRGLDCIY